MLIFTNGALLVSSAFTAFFMCCCSRDALLEEVARFLLDARTGGHPITGAPGDLKLDVGRLRNDKVVPAIQSIFVEIVNALS